jgi:hypothetical protein
MWRESNASAARLAARLGKVAIAGSDSHTIAGAGLTYTEVPGARTVEEYFAGLRAGRGRVHGESGSYWKITADVYRIIWGMLQEKPWAAMLAPISVLVPAFTAGHWLNEIRFCKKWSAVLERQEKRPRMLWEVDSPMEASLAG